MEFEFDSNKSRSNKSKHGIDFLEAQAIWEDPDRLEVSARTQGERRFMLIGMIGRNIWSAIFTCRENRVRIISVRRARKEEVQHYEG